MQVGHEQTRSRITARSSAAVAVAIVGCVFGAWTSKADAQAPASGRAQPPVIELGEDFVIEGHVQKPEAFYFLRRTPFGFVIRTLDEDFLDEVVRSVDAEPF